MGDVDRVKGWFDEAGRPALGDLDRHYPVNDPEVRANLQLGAGSVQQVLDAALAWACMNKRFDVASFLLDHGADINTRWGTHEPASILHECAVHGNYQTARFLIDHGIDMTIRDHRYDATAEGWARYAAGDEAMADFLAAASQARDTQAGSAAPPQGTSPV
jgi:ankyrin repeat protein